MVYSFVKSTAEIIDIVGVCVIIFGGIISSITYVYSWLDGKNMSTSFTHYQQSLGKVILLGLEFLVAADIIGSIAVSPTFSSVGILGLIVVIRTFLSIGLRVEIDGRWPWQKEK